MPRISRLHRMLSPGAGSVAGAHEQLSHSFLGTYGSASEWNRGFPSSYELAWEVGS